MKRCSKCREKKNAAEFHRNTLRADGLAVWCKACVKTARADWYSRNRERLIELSTQWIADNREQFNSTARKNWPGAHQREKEHRNAAQQRRAKALFPSYVRATLRWKDAPKEVVEHHKLNIQICRTRRLFSTLATAAILNP